MKIEGYDKAKKAAFENESLLPDDCRVLLYEHVGYEETVALGHEKFKELIFDLLRQQIDNPEKAWGEEVEELVTDELTPLTDEDHAVFARWEAECKAKGISLVQGLSLYNNG